MLRLSDHLHMGVDGSMITAPVVLVSAVFLDDKRAVRVIFDKDSVRVGGTLVVLIDVGVRVFFTLVSRHELYLFLFVAWKYRL